MPHVRPADRRTTPVGRLVGLGPFRWPGSARGGPAAAVVTSRLQIDAAECVWSVTSHMWEGLPLALLLCRRQQRGSGADDGSHWPMATSDLRRSRGEGRRPPPPPPPPVSVMRMGE